VEEKKGKEGRVREARSSVHISGSVSAVGILPVFVTRVNLCRLR